MKNRKTTYAVLALIASIVFFILGLIFPLFYTKKSILGIGLSFQDIKLTDSIEIFINSGDWFLASTIFIFTLILPITKYLDLLNRIFQFVKLTPKLSLILQKIDKWSMMDVFLVALLLINFKLDSNIIVMNLKIGTTFLALSVLLRMLAADIATTPQKKRMKLNSH